VAQRVAVNHAQRFPTRDRPFALSRDRAKRAVAIRTRYGAALTERERPGRRSRIQAERDATPQAGARSPRTRTCLIDSASLPASRSSRRKVGRYRSPKGSLVQATADKEWGCLPTSAKERSGCEKEVSSPADYRRRLVDPREAPRRSSPGDSIRACCRRHRCDGLLCLPDRAEHDDSNDPEGGGRSPSGWHVRLVSMVDLEGPPVVVTGTDEAFALHGNDGEEVATEPLERVNLLSGDVPSDPAYPTMRSSAWSAHVWSLLHRSATARTE